MDQQAKLNTARARRFAEALKVANLDDNDDETALSDLIADAMHWCDKHRVDFDAAVARGHSHYCAEFYGEE